MPSRNAAVAEAVKTALNAAAVTDTAFGATFVATRVYVPGGSLADEKFRGWAVEVFFAEQDREEERAGADHLITIEVGLRKRLKSTADPMDPAANAEIDGLFEVAERVSDFFGPSETTYGGARWIETKLSGPNPELLLNDRIFVCFCTLKFMRYV